MNDNNNPSPIDPIEPTLGPAPLAGSAPSAAKAAQHEPGWERATLEKLAFAALNEQKATRRWKTVVRLSWLAFFIALVWLALHRGSAPSSVTTPHTAVVEIRGEIAEGADASAEFVNSALRAAFEDEGARAVVLLINSPGGSPVQAGLMNDEILRLKAKLK